jgi:hypothetical protein
MPAGCPKGWSPMPSTHSREPARGVILVVHSLIPSVSARWNGISSTGAIDAVCAPEIDRWPGMDQAFDRALAGHPGSSPTPTGRTTAVPRRLGFAIRRPVPCRHSVPKLWRRPSTENRLSFTVPTPDVLIAVAINRDRVGFGAAIAPPVQGRPRPSATPWSSARKSGWATSASACARSRTVWPASSAAPYSVMTTPV